MKNNMPKYEGNLTPPPPKAPTSRKLSSEIHYQNNIRKAQKIGKRLIKNGVKTIVLTYKEQRYKITINKIN